MSEFKPVVGLNGLGLVAKMTDGHLYKLDSGIGRLLTEGVNEPFATSGRVLSGYGRASEYMAFSSGLLVGKSPVSEGSRKVSRDGDDSNA